MSEASDGITAIKIRIPRLPGADEAEADLEERGNVALADPEGPLEMESAYKGDPSYAFDDREDPETSAPLTDFEELLPADPSLTDAGTDPERTEERLALPAFTPEPVVPSTGKIRILVILGHPREGSLCEGIAEAYADAALAGGHEVRMLPLRTLDFDLHECQQDLEPCLESAQESLVWAEHVVFVFPVWWGSMPALLKGFLDRTFRADFAFRERPEGGWEGLLAGRTAEMLVTMDTPRWVFDYVQGKPAVRALRDSTLGFCGIGPARVISFGPVLHSTPQQRSRWLDQASEAARQAQARHRTGWRPQLKAWRDAARLQFYLFPALVVLLGAFTAANTLAAPVAWVTLSLAILAAVTLEFVTVLTNEWHDLPSDSRNQNSSLFNGGSRVLVENRLSILQLLRGRNVALAVLLVITTVLALTVPAVANPVLVPILVMLGLGMGLAYTAPPVKLCSRGLGEVAVAFTHSVLVFWLGYATQGGSLTSLLPWTLVAPMFFAILPAILLAGLPDMEADELVGKKTLAVRLGRRRLTKTALAMVVVSALLHIALVPFSGWFLTLPLVLHAGWLSRGILDYLARPQPGRIDGLLLRALTYMFWFFLAPLLS